MIMKAEVGDRIVIGSRHLDESARDGEIIEVHGADGAPPYLIRWAEDGHTALLYPGSDAHISHPVEGQAIIQHVKAWRVTIYLSEKDDRTTADAVLETGVTTVRGHGEAHRNPSDSDIPEIGDELATCRALIDLGDHLLTTAEADLARIEGKPVHLTR
jgi:hypothetical protein